MENTKAIFIIVGALIAAIITLLIPSLFHTPSPNLLALITGLSIAMIGLFQLSHRIKPTQKDSK